MTLSFSNYYIFKNFMDQFELHIIIYILLHIGLKIIRNDGIVILLLKLYTMQINLIKYEIVNNFYFTYSKKILRYLIQIEKMKYYLNET